MKLSTLFVIISLFFSVSALSQKVIRHKVKQGESIYALAKKYEVTEKEIFELNPKLKGAVLGLNDEVKIPNKKSKAAQTAPQKKTKTDKIQDVPSTELLPSHLVLAKETLYGISKKYNISIETIERLNPEITEGGLKKGMVLQLASGFEEQPSAKPEAKQPETTTFEKPNQNTVAEIKAEDKPQPKNKRKDKKTAIEPKPVSEPEMAAVPKPLEEAALTHKVQPKESLYRISKKYNTSVAELQQLNPDVASGLPVGYELIISKGTAKKEIKDTGTVTETVSDVVSVSPLTVENLSKAEFLIAKASENLGVRYRSGGTSPAGFDCSGLMFSTFKNIDMVLPRSSYDMAKYGTRVERSQAQKGDLIFFSTFGRGRVSHVGMVTEVNDDEIKFIHSSTQAGVIISSTKEDYYARTFVQVNRVLAQ